MTWDDVARLALELPDVEVSTSYGTPAVKMRGKLLTRLRPDDQSLVLWDVPADERDMLLEAEPQVFHVTPHYDGYPIILARLQALDEGRAWSFLERRWRTVAPKRVVQSWDAGKQSRECEPAAAISGAALVPASGASRIRTTPRASPSPLAGEGGSRRQARDG